MLNVLHVCRFDDTSIFCRSFIYISLCCFIPSAFYNAIHKLMHTADYIPTLEIQNPYTSVCVCPGHVILIYPCHSEANEFYIFPGQWHNKPTVNYDTIIYATGKTLVCRWRFEHVEGILLYLVPKKHLFSDFLVILKPSLQNCKKIVKECYW